jgi:hypothetical protein
VCLVLPCATRRVAALARRHDSMNSAARRLDEEAAPKEEEEFPPHLPVPELPVPGHELPPFPEVHDLPSKPELPPFPEVDLPPIEARDPRRSRVPLPSACRRNTGESKAKSTSLATFEMLLDSASGGGERTQEASVPWGAGVSVRRLRRA